MRLFWSFILILVVGGAAAAWWQSGANVREERGESSVTTGAAASESRVAPPQPVPVPPTPPAEPAPAVSAPTPTAAPAPEATPSFVVRGRGSAKDPFWVDWDLLLSAKETYDPPAGKREMPKQITMLNGATVRITGYFAAPIGEESTSELLVMLNKWDGCCLGLPPTPYDAVEVRLAEPVRLTGQHVIRYGTVTGRFSADPFLVADFIMGLYRIEDARVEWGG
ncbi:MAG: hypothetical protein KDA22_07995 [Phycisphaerales bacterium]|nr:hypothetical protein [Phycisphaerales bacterium]